MVCAVEEGEVGFLAEKGGELFPLLWCGVHASRVVSAGMQEDDTVVWGFGDGFFHASKIKTFRSFREVGVCGNGDVDVVKDLVVVGPCWVANVDCRLLVELREEESAEMDSPSAGNGLYGMRALLSESWGICSQDEFRCRRSESRETGDGEVFVI